MRVLLAANLFISYLLNPQRLGTIQTIFQALKQERFILLAPSALFEEISTVVTNRPHLTPVITKAHAVELQRLIESLAEMLPSIAEPLPTVVRDRKDDYLIAYAVVGEADYLVAGDDDLLALKQVGNVQIIAPAAFARLLQ